MEKFISQHTEIQRVVIPPSKSYAQRAILSAALSHNQTVVQSVGKSNDVAHFLEMSKQLGATISKLASTEEESYQIKGFSATPLSTLNAGESGLGIRLIVPVCAVLKGNFSLHGKGSLLRRPMDEFAAYLPQLSVDVKMNEGFLPLQLKGDAAGGTIELDGSLSSQYLSGLLMALPLLKEDSTVNVHQLQSTPYIDITLDVLKAFGIEIINKNYAQFVIRGGQAYKRDQPYKVESDYSGASIWMVYGAINNGLTISGLNQHSVQGDKMMLTALESANVAYQWTASGDLQIFKSEVQPFEFDARHCPDLFPALVVLAASAYGKTTLSGMTRLIHKESNRATVLQKEFAKTGLTIDLEGDFMHVHGTGRLLSGSIHSNNDHRIAMAGAIASALTDSGITVEDAQSVAKSYPEFWDVFNP